MSHIKNIIILAVLIFSFSIYGNYKFSIKAGVSYSMTNHKDNNSDETINEIETGIDGRILLDFKYNILDEKLYIGLGLGTSSRTFGDLSISVFDIPMFIGFRVNDLLSLYLGGYYSITYGGENAKDYYYYGDLKYDYGFLGGIEFSIDNFIFDIQYQYGRTIIYDPRAKGELDDYYYNISQISLMIGYRFF